VVDHVDDHEGFAVFASADGGVGEFACAEKDVVEVFEDVLCEASSDLDLFFIGGGGGEGSRGLHIWRRRTHPLQTTIDGIQAQHKHLLPLLLNLPYILHGKLLPNTRHHRIIDLIANLNLQPPLKIVLSELAEREYLHIGFRNRPF
jgi:hypothetical protein